MLPLLGVGIVAALSVAIWTSSDPSPSRPSFGVLGTEAHATEAQATEAQATAPATSASPLRPTRTSTVHASRDGYRATVRSSRSGEESHAATTLDVVLSRTGEPASASSAQVQLIGANGVTHSVVLTAVGVGHWNSRSFRIAAGTYTLVARFGPAAGPVTISTTIRLT